MKIITINGNKGKTTLGVFLSRHLSMTSKVCLIFTDDTVPILPSIYSGEIKSLGGLLSLPRISDLNILEHLNTVKGHHNLVVLGYGKGESGNSYQNVVTSSLTEFKEVIGNIVDCLVVVSMTKHSAVDSYFDKIATYKLKLFSADTKGISYHQSSTIENSVNILVNSNINNSIADVQNALYTKNIPIIPYCKELEKAYNGYNFFEEEIPKKYKKFITTIETEVII